VAFQSGILVRLGHGKPGSNRGGPRYFTENYRGSCTSSRTIFKDLESVRSTLYVFTSTAFFATPAASNTNFESVLSLTESRGSNVTFSKPCFAHREVIETPIPGPELNITRVQLLAISFMY
jgi:hypothetical protein